MTGKARKLHIIGAGHCGTVWAPYESGPAFKLENTGTDRSLRNDYQKHERVMYSFQKGPRFPRIQVPDCYNIINATDQDWWNRAKERFPKEQMPCNVILAERILPFPETTMRLLIHQYCTQGHPPEKILRDEADQNCLIRPYLGRSRAQQTQIGTQQEVFSLRDFPLHLDEMEELGISKPDMSQYARIMAEALAIMHWTAKIDGYSVEFVLAPPWSEAIKDDTISNTLGEHCMWLLDFDLCSDMTMDEAGVQKAVRAFWSNDQYYPRPAKDEAMWQAFREQYLQSCDERLEFQFFLGGPKLDHRRSLARLFIELVEEGSRCKQRVP